MSLAPGPSPGVCLFPVASHSRSDAEASLPGPGLGSPGRGSPSLPRGAAASWPRAISWPCSSCAGRGEATGDLCVSTVWPGTSRLTPFSESKSSGQNRMAPSGRRHAPSRVSLRGVQLHSDARSDQKTDSGLQPAGHRVTTWPFSPCAR